MNEFTLFRKTIKNIQFYDLKAKVDAVLPEKTFGSLNIILKQIAYFIKGWLNWDLLANVAVEQMGAWQRSETESVSQLMVRMDRWMYWCWEMER